MSRSSLLALSIILSLAVHGLILVVAPNVTMLRTTTRPEDVLVAFHVRLTEEEIPAIETEALEGDASGLTSGPSSIEDLLKRETEALKPADSLLERPMEVPLLAERLASESIEREHDLDLDESKLNALDTRVIEITQAEMREDIQVTRRLVQPSSMRILDEDILPVLRGEFELDREEVLLVKSMNLAGGTPRSTAKEAIAEDRAGPPPEPGILEVIQPIPPVQEVPGEREIARAPVAEAIRKETQAYQFIDDLVDISLETYVPSNEKVGYFRLRIAPKQDEDIEILPKDVTFVVDASSSILQRKLDKTVAGLLETIGALRPEDRFNIVVFRDSPSIFQPEPILATHENKQDARKFLTGLQSRGQTDVYAAVRPVVEMPPRSGVPGVVVVITDGRPTTGIRDARTIINAVTDNNRLRNSVFAYGAGRTVNQYLLDLLAYRNKGESFISPDLEQIPRDLPQFFARLEEPILVECTADFGRIDEESIFPRELPDFYRGQAVTVYGRFDPSKDGQFAMRLTGKAGAREKELVFKADLTRAASGTDQIAKNWGFRKIYHLIGEMCSVGETPELRAELRSLSQKYGIRTSYDL